MANLTEPAGSANTDLRRKLCKNREKLSKMFK